MNAKFNNPLVHYRRDDMTFDLNVTTFNKDDFLLVAVCGWPQIQNGFQGLELN